MDSPPNNRYFHTKNNHKHMAATTDKIPGTCLSVFSHENNHRHMAATTDEIPGIFCRVALRDLPDHTVFSPSKLADFIEKKWLKTDAAIRNLYRYVEHADKQAPIQNYIDQMVDIFKTPDQLEFYCKHPVDLVFEVEESYELRDYPDEIEKQLVETSA